MLQVQFASIIIVNVPFISYTILSTLKKWMMANEPLVSVVIATYNGSKYLPEQLASIFNQTYSNIEVIVCDDRSTDTTLDILKDFQRNFRLTYYVNETKQGVVKNFENAIKRAQGDYVALSDQDDVWQPDKIALSMKRLKQIEMKATPNTPALVFTDLAVVSENLQAISPSYWVYMKLNPANTQLNRVLVENVATGCTILVNKALINTALPIPNAALMHDVWLLLVATCFGRVSYLSDQTVLYRQHNNNVVGARQTNLLQKLSGGIHKLRSNNFSLLGPEINQAKAFYARYHHRLNAEQEKKVLEAFISLKDKSPFKKKLQIMKYGFYGSTLKKAFNVFFRA